MAQTKTGRRPLRYARSTLLPVVAGLFILSIVSGCGLMGGNKAEPAPPPKVEAPAPEPQPLTHTVAYPGESLSIISLWYTGSLANWEKIAQANPDLDVNRMRIGQEIKIPNELLLRQEAMPERFVQKFAPKEETPAEAMEAESPAPMDEPEAIEPIAAPQELPEEPPAEAMTPAAPAEPDSAATETESPTTEPEPEKPAPRKSPPVLFGPKDY